MPKITTSRKTATISSVKKATPTCIVKGTVARATPKATIKSTAIRPQSIKGLTISSKELTKIVAQLFNPFDADDVLQNGPTIGEKEPQSPFPDIFPPMPIDELIKRLIDLIKKLKEMQKKAPKKAPKKASKKKP